MKQAYSVRWRGHRGRLGIGAASPWTSVARSPASTPYCDGHTWWRARFLDSASGDSPPRPEEATDGGAVPTLRRVRCARGDRGRLCTSRRRVTRALRPPHGGDEHAGVVGPGGVAGQSRVHPRRDGGDGRVLETRLARVGGP